MDEQQPYGVPAPSPAPRRNAGLLIAAIIIIVLVVCAGIFLYPPSRAWLMNLVGGKASTVTLRSEAGNAVYSLSGTTLTLMAPAKAATKTAFYVTESAATTTQAGTPVIGGPSATAPARTVALLTKDNRLTVLYLSPTQVRDITAGPNGLVAFSAEVTSTSTHATASHVFVASLSMKAKDLGPGADPVFAKNGNIIALAPEGLVEINPYVGTRMSRLGVPYTKATGLFLIGPNASFAVLPNGVTHKEDVYAINSAAPASMSFVGSFAAPQALGGIDSASFAAQTDDTHAIRYAVGKTLSAGAALTLIK